MHFPDRRPDHSEERILPLINVVFLLLIFFMIAGSLSVSEPFDVEPPASQSEARNEEPDARMILMAEDGRFALDNQELTEQELLDEITSIMDEEPQTPITLKADGSLPANQLVRFTQALYDADVQKLRLLTEPEDV